MRCKIYSALLVICVTLMIIFSKFNGSHIRILYQYQYSFRNAASFSRFVDTKLPSQQQQRIKFVTEKDSQLFHMNKSSTQERISELMENNNSEIKENDMDSPVTELKNLSVSEDTTDERFSGNFNIKELNGHLRKCIRENDREVDMDEYIQIFQQLYKFFCMLGTLFGFIGSDVKSKIEILQEYRDGNNKTHYETVEKMIEFEKSTDYIHSNKASSGSRTFLRLHRSLIFVSKFLGKMDEIGEQDGISRICKDAYAQTLAKFHPWIIQKGAGLAMLGLPTKKDLITKVCVNGIVEDNEVLSIMNDVIRLTSLIYDHCERVYTENDLHGLP